MRFLLTSAGIKNTIIHDALVDLLGNRLPSPTPSASPPRCTPIPTVLAMHGGSSAARSQNPHVRIGLEVLGSAGAHRAAQHRSGEMDPHGPGDRRPAGGRRRSLVSVLLDAPVRIGGPLAVAARGGLRGTERREHGDGPQHRGGLRSLEAATGGDETLGLVEFSMFPHLDHEDLPENSMADAERWAAGMPVPGYAIDDQTAIKVTDGAVEVVSEGRWKLFTP